MTKLPKFTLSKNAKTQRWDLTNDKTDKVVKSFKTKEVATKGRVLAKALGEDGGSVKIKKQDNKYQEERTYPGEKDPPGSKG